MNYKPAFYRLQESYGQKKEYEKLLKQKNPKRYDTIISQIEELILCRNPLLQRQEVEDQQLAIKHIKSTGLTSDCYGVWVYYSWNNTMVHILDEEEFVEVRTNRNKYKITQQEQDVLRTKKIGIIGLSVGRAIAMTMAIERTVGAFVLADHDSIELSNLNRIIAPITELGMNKCIATAQEIATIDPFLKVTCFIDGVNAENIHDFFTKNGTVNILAEECDDMTIKILSRLKARELKIPVVMETNDNCIIDIERFDLEPNRPIFHGKLTEEDIQKGLDAQTFADKTAFILKIYDTNKISHGMKTSLAEVGKTIRSWPQIGSEVIGGGALLVQIISSILSGLNLESGQHYYQHINAKFI